MKDIYIRFFVVGRHLGDQTWPQVPRAGDEVQLYVTTTELKLFRVEKVRWISGTAEVHMAELTDAG